MFRSGSLRGAYYVTATARLRRIAKSTALRSWLVAGFLCSLLAVETFAVVHPLDLAAHSNGEPCKICVGAASLDHAVAADAPILSLEPAVADAVAATGLAFRSTAPVRQAARGPPLLS
jgi:hypothetical protein